jgi:three-Cys-motif partner protein
MAEEDPFLIDVPCCTRPQPLKFARSDNPIWTENKAKLIERYIHFFVYVTKHGTYIDGFSGPQREGRDDLWAAKLVLEDRPTRIRHFFLFEKSPRKVERLNALKQAQLVRKKGECKRDIHIFQGDCNVNILRMLKEYPVKDKEATFALLDQRTFECDWATVVALANHKKAGHKIELFYFLAQGWIDRSVKAKRKNKAADMRRWWGNDGWDAFFRLMREDRREHFRKRFVDELGYKHAYAFAIYDKKDGGKTMYWMIHATDHDEAPKLMNRAYRQALNLKGKAVQVELIPMEKNPPSS